MCRNIKKLRRPGRRVPTDHELHDAALQFVRKISGYHAPSELNRQAFETAVQEVAGAARLLFSSLHVRPIHNHRERNERRVVRSVPQS